MTSRFALIAGYFGPPFRTLRNYRLRDLPHDLVAGLTVSVVDLPQSMAFAVIAGVSPVYGIYTAIIQALLGGLFTSSRFLSNGPTNTQSLLVAAIITRLTSQHGGDYLQLVFGLTILKGIIQLLFAAARMGSLVRYVSNSVMVGFTAGAGVLIMIEQVPNFLGLHLQHSADALPGLAGAIQRILPHLHEINPPAVLLGSIALAAVLAGRWLPRYVPTPLLAVVGAAVAVWALGLSDSVRVVGQLPAGLPLFHLPHLNLLQFEQLLTGAVALAVLGMLESVSIAKAIAMRTGQRIDANQEFFGQGFSNLVAGFFQCMPGSGSFSRSALQYAMGARTRMCSVFCAAFNAVVFLLLADDARFIPFAVLAAILFVIGAKLIDTRNLVRIVRTSRSDAAVCIITFASTLLLPLQYAIYVGIFLNLALYLRLVSQLQMAEMVHTSGGPYIERPLQEKTGARSVMFLQIEGALFFGVADELRDRLTRLLNEPVRVVIFRLKRTHSVDSTVLQVFDDFARQMREQGRHVILCGLRPELVEVMERFGLANTVGRLNVFETGFGVFTSAKRALQRAKELLGSSIDAQGIDTDETEGWAYEI